MARPSFIPAVFVWGFLGAIAVAIVVTYWRIPAGDLYHVTGEGAAGGFGRALVFLNFSAALAVLPLIALAADRMRDRRSAVVAAIAGAALCAVVFWPGVVDQDSLDPRLVNALPALGVGIALVLTYASGLFGVRARVHPAAAVFSVALLLLGIPWIAAELGFYLDGVPVLGRIFLTGTLYEGEPAVHYGHHHGLDGTFLALSALAVVPLVRRIEVRPLRTATGLYTGLALAYGLANVLNDAWFEQLGKRGTVDWRIPSVLNPKPSIPWLLIVLAALVFAALILRPQES